MPIRHAYLIEDNPTIRSNLIPTLSEMADVEVIGMAEGEHEAMDWLIQFSSQADFIILDLFLAEGSGLGVLRQVAVHHIKIPVVVLTNYATQDIRERCKALGAAALFDKSRELEGFLAYCAEPGTAGLH